MDKIRICPFCAGDDNRIVSTGNRRQVQCIECGSSGPSVLDIHDSTADTDAKAVAEWNIAPRLLSVRQERMIEKIKRAVGDAP